MARPAEFERSKVVEQAMYLFWSHGYDGTSTQALSNAMGLKPGSLYNAFCDKHSLFLESLDYYQSTVGQCLYAPLLEADAGIEAIRQVFINGLEQALSEPLQRGCFLMNATLERTPDDREVARRAEQGYHQAETLFFAALTRSRVANAPQNETQDLHVIASYLISGFQGLQITAKINPNREKLTAIMNTILSVLT